MGGGNSGGGNSTTNTVAQPWAQQVPYLMEAFQGAQDLYRGYGPQYGQDINRTTTSPYGVNPSSSGYGTQNAYGIGGLSPVDQIQYIQAGGQPLPSRSQNYQGTAGVPGPQYWPGSVTSDLSNATRTGNNLARSFADNQYPTLYSDLANDQLRNSSAQQIAQMQGQYYGGLPSVVAAGAQDYYGAESPLNAYANSLGGMTQAKSLGQSEAVQRMQRDLSLGTSIQGINQAYQTPGIGIGLDYLNASNDMSSMNPYLGQMGNAATRDIIRQYQEKVLPGISQEAIGAGQFGGSRQAIAEGIAARGTSENISDAIANLYGTAYGQNLEAQTQRQGQGLQYLQGTAGQNLDYLQQGRQLSANFYGDIEQAAQARALQGSQSMADFGLGIGGLAGQRYGTNVGTWADIANQQAGNSLDQQFRFASIAPQTMQAGLLGSDVYGQIGSLHDERARAELENQIQRWDYEQNAPWANLDRYFGLVGSNMGGGSSQTSTKVPGRTTTGRVAGGVTGAAGGAIAGGTVAGVPGAVVGGLLGALAGAL